MIFFVPFGINQHSLIFPGLQIAPALWACAIWLAFDGFLTKTQYNCGHDQVLRDG